MELNAYLDKLRSKLEAEFQEQGSSNSLSSIYRKISIVENCLEDLKSFVASYKFASRAEEISFFKKQKPEFTSQLYYLRYLRRISFFESLNSQDDCEVFYKRIVLEIQHFLCRNKKHYLYLMSDRSDLDLVYFTRTTNDSSSPICNRKYDARVDKLTAIILGKLLLKNHLQRLINRPKKENVREGLDWSASKTDLIELIYALHTSKVFGANKDLKEVVMFFEKLFDCQLGQYSRTFLELRLRKKGQTKFLDELKSRLVERIESFEQ